MERLKRQEGGGWRDGKDNREEDGEIEKTRGRGMDRIRRKER